MGKIKKAVVLVLKNTKNLFRTDGIALFDLWDLPINSFGNQVIMVTTSNITKTENVKTKLKRKFPEVFFFSEGFGTCTKTKAKFEVKNNATPVFKPKRSLLLRPKIQSIRNWKGYKIYGVISKVDESKWASPTVYVKKKNNKIRICADLLTMLNDSLQNYNYPLLNPEKFLLN